MQKVKMSMMTGKKLFTFCVLVTLSGAPELARAANTPLEIALSAQVQDMLKNAAPDRKKRLNDAIQAGNFMITQFLDYSALQDAGEWSMRTGSLLAMTVKEFSQMMGEWNKARQSLLVCPNISLVELTETAKNEVDINYQATRIGILISEGTQLDKPKPATPYAVHYSPEGKGKLHRVQVNINANNRLVNAIPQDKLLPQSYKISQSSLKSANLRQAIYQGETDALVQARVASYDKATNEMDQAAAKVCELARSETLPAK